MCIYIYIYTLVYVHHVQFLFDCLYENTLCTHCTYTNADAHVNIYIYTDSPGYPPFCSARSRSVLSIQQT